MKKTIITILFFPSILMADWSGDFESTPKGTDSGGGNFVGFSFEESSDINFSIVNPSFHEFFLDKIDYFKMIEDKISSEISVRGNYIGISFDGLINIESSEGIPDFHEHFLGKRIDFSMLEDGETNSDISNAHLWFHKDEILNRVIYQGEEYLQENNKEFLKEFKKSNDGFSDKIKNGIIQELMSSGPGNGPKGTDSGGGN